MQGILNAYDSGLLVSDVNLQDAQPPEEVQGAFSDAIKAREDRVRLTNEAEAYANEVIPKARGAAARKLQEATAYKESLIAKATGEASRFSQLATEYKKSPEVTRKRLYLETMEQVLSGTSKVIMDSKGGNNLMYLPVDQLLKQGQAARGPRNAPRIEDDTQSGIAEIERPITSRPIRESR
jgi:membrane protease subunit HflK